MRKLLLALAIALAPTAASAACTGLFAGGTLCGNPSSSSATGNPHTYSAFSIPTLSGNNVWTGTNEFLSSVSFAYVPTFPVQSANTFFGGPASGAAATPTFRTLSNSDLPNPTVDAIGGVKALSEVASRWINAIFADGTPQLSQVAFTDLFGTLSSGQVVNGSIGNEKLTYSATTVNGANCVLGSTCSVGNEAPPPAGGSYSGLAIKVLSTVGYTEVGLSASSLVVTNGAGSYLTLESVSCNIDLSTNGAGGLDTGTISAATWYFVWALAQSDGTQSCEASLLSSATATFVSNLPSGYTYYGRYGAVRTDTSTAQLMGTWQLGDTAQYKVGLAKTTRVATIFQGVLGTFSTTAPTYAAVSVANIVPSTASQINAMAYNNYNNNSNGSVYLAPNNSYSGALTSNPPPFAILPTNAILYTSPGWMILEGSTVYGTGSATGSAALALGWKDNL